MTDLSRDDPTREPDPNGGWSARVRQVAGALVVPATVPDMVQPAGVFDADGGFVHEAVLWRGRPLMVEPPRPAPEEHLPGRWLWGGVLLNHFGHFLTESTGRLWASRAGLDGVVFISKRSEPDETGSISLHGFQRTVFDLLGVTLPVRVITRPTTVEQLEVPGQGFGIGAISAGTDIFRDFVLGRFGHGIPAEGAQDLYISRSALGAARGGVLEETRIETFLSAYGYDIFHPQQHSLTDQIARYKAARRIVALDGSALHLVAMLGLGDQRVAVIRRRNSSVAQTIVRHLHSFMGRAPDVIDVITRDWVREGRGRADRHSVGELDFPALAARLGEHGYVPAGAVMPSLTEAEARAAIAAVEGKLRRGGIRFEPLERGGKRTREAPPTSGTETPAPPISERRAARLARRAARAARG